MQYKKLIKLFFSFSKLTTTKFSDWSEQIQSKQSETEPAPKVNISQSTSPWLINLRFAKLDK